MEWFKTEMTPSPGEQLITFILCEDEERLVVKDDLEPFQPAKQGFQGVLDTMYPFQIFLLFSKVCYF